MSFGSLRRRSGDYRSVAAVHPEENPRASCSWTRAFLPSLSGLSAHLKEELTETHTLPADGSHGFGRDGDSPDGSTGAGQSSGTTGTGFCGGSASGATQTY